MKPFGRFHVAAIDAGTLRIDGGTMFGVVPRAAWSKVLAPDEQNHVELALRPLLIADDADRRILIDTGVGDKPAALEDERFPARAPEGGLVGAVRRAGVEPEEITDVILTHLHFDHAGGATRIGPNGEPRPTFPNATYHLQRRALKWAQHAPEKDSEFFRGADFQSLATSGQLHLLDGPHELYEGIELVLSEGHTVAMQLPVLDGGEDGRLFYCGDLVPTRAHVQLNWLMAYDLYPLTSLEEKRLLLAQALEEDWLLFLEHDASCTACRVVEQEGGVLAGDPINW